ncbi:MAG: hypothetical protein WD969_11795 [Paracoccaceae bacterium]
MVSFAVEHNRAGAHCERDMNAAWPTGWIGPPLIGRNDLSPAGAVDTVSGYYAQIIALATFAEGLRGEGFLSMPRRADTYADFIGMKMQAPRNAKTAPRALDRGVAGFGAGAAPKLNNPASGRGDPQSEEQVSCHQP